MSLLRSRILTVTVPLVVVGAAVFVTACSNTSSYTHYNSDGSTLPLGDPPAQICKNPPVSPYNYRYAGSSDTEVAYVSGTQPMVHEGRIFQTPQKVSSFRQAAGKVLALPTAPLSGPKRPLLPMQFTGSQLERTTVLTRLLRMTTMCSWVHRGQ
jgi:hypothetical protein